MATIHIEKMQEFLGCLYRIGKDYAISVVVVDSNDKIQGPIARGFVSHCYNK
jgi:hypothetical protein